jgi:hypothetical protein
VQYSALPLGGKGSSHIPSHMPASLCRKCENSIIIIVISIITSAGTSSSQEEQPNSSGELQHWHRGGP